MTDFNRRRLLLGAASAAGVLGAGAALQSCDRLTKPPAARVRIGWQTAWASQGQVMEGLIRTDIPTLAGADLAFNGFQYGPDLNEAAIGGSIDVTNAGIVPVINLLAKSPDWAIIGRQTDFYVSIIARPNSGVRTVADLKGKRFAVPIGGGSHPFAVSELKKAGLGDADVDIVNVPPTEMLLAFKKGDVDAVAVWDPTAQLIVEAGGAIIAEQAYVGFITGNRKFLEREPAAAQAMLEAYGMAYLYAAKNKAQTDAWFAQDSGMPQALVSRLRVIEPNLKATELTAVKLTPTAASLALCQQVADTMLSLGLLKARLDVSARTFLEPSRKAEEHLGRLKSKFDTVKIT